MSSVGPLDWANLADISQELVSKDYHGVPVVQRDVQGILRDSAAARARTSRVRSERDQAAAERLLAQQGLDATRLNQAVSGLDLQPTIEEAFQAETSNVEEYLTQLKEMTILMAIQEAQQDTLTSFDYYMDECLSREWAKDKQQLVSLAVSRPVEQQGEPREASSPVPLGSKEAAYIEVVKAMTEATAQEQRFNAAAAFKEACSKEEGQSQGASIVECWTLLENILSKADMLGKGPGTGDLVSGAHFLEALVDGARGYLEKQHEQYMRTQVSNKRTLALRGAEPDQIREVQAYLALKYPDKTLDFQAAGGLDTSWIQVYYCLRNGWLDTALRAAEGADEMCHARIGGESFKSWLELWRHNRASFRASKGPVVLRELERLKQPYRTSGALLRSRHIKQDYMLLLHALLVGDVGVVELLNRHGSNLTPSFEDYMWVHLTLVNTQPGPSDARGGPAGTSLGSSSTVTGVPTFTMNTFQAELNRWPESYYSQNGRQPLLYLTILLLTLQFKAALKFLTTHTSTSQYHIDAVHMAITLHHHRVLQVGTQEADAGVDVGGLIKKYGEKFARSDVTVALCYYMLAAAVRGNSLVVKGQLLRELLRESHAYGTLLGQGGIPGQEIALSRFIRSPRERSELFEYIASECQISGQPEEAVECYIAAGKPRSALVILNHQLSDAISSMRETTLGDRDHLLNTINNLMSRSTAAEEKLRGQTGGTTQQEIEVLQQLKNIRDLLYHTYYEPKNYEAAINNLKEVKLVPVEQQAVDACLNRFGSTSPALQERLSDVLMAACEVISGLQVKNPRRTDVEILRSQINALKAFATNVRYPLRQEVFQKLADCAGGLS